VDVEKYAYTVCQQTSPKRWFGNMTMTPNCDVTNSAHQYKWPPYTTEWSPPPRKFSAYATAREPHFAN